VRRPRWRKYPLRYVWCRRCGHRVQEGRREHAPRAAPSCRVGALYEGDGILLFCHGWHNRWHVVVPSETDPRTGGNGGP